MKIVKTKNEHLILAGPEVSAHLCVCGGKSRLEGDGAGIGKKLPEIICTPNGLRGRITFANFHSSIEGC